jgi:hypothetical protein
MKNKRVRGHLKGRYCSIKLESNERAHAWLKLLRVLGVRARRKGYTVIAKSTKRCRDILDRLHAEFIEVDITGAFGDWGKCW